MRFLFVGEQPSDLARKTGVTWRDGRLAAKQLFDALRFCGIEPRRQRFVNLFRGTRINRQVMRQVKSCRLPVVAMGKKVQVALSAERIAFIPIVHPAARGLIRRKERYCEHVRLQFRENRNYSLAARYQLQ